jgi:hypothetical protein
MTNEQYEIDKVKKTLGTLITWLAQTSGSALSISDAEELLKMLNEPQK